jgi:hypothetical protein
MVLKTVWLRANPNDDGMLCISCLERRLGRILNRYDFITAPINIVEFQDSSKLINRLINE